MIVDKIGKLNLQDIELLITNGQYAEAISALRLVSDLFDNPPALTLWGISHSKLELHQEAIKALELVVAFLPTVSGSFFNLANAHRNAGNNTDALSLYRQAAELSDKDPAVWFNLGNTCRDCGHLADAEMAYRRALDLRANYAAATISLARLLVKRNDKQEAIRYYRQYLSLRPKDLIAPCELAGLYAARHEFNAAIELLQPRAVADPHDIRVCQTYLDCLLSAGRVNDAYTHLIRLSFSEELVPYAVRVSQLLRESGALELSCELASLAAKTAPLSSLSLNNLGLSLLALGELEQAIQVLEQAVECGHSAESLNNLAVALQASGRWEKSMELLNQSLLNRPDFGLARLNRAFSLLRDGDFASGWPEMEWRRVLAEGSHFRELAWRGEPVTQLFIRAEQGIGDTFQFIRYCEAVKQHCQTVVLICPERLHQLLSRCPGIDGFLHDGDPRIDERIAVPMMSLPAILKTTLATIPSRIPYIFPDPELVTQWGSRIDGRKLNVGIAWQGNRDYVHDRHRSIPLRHYQSLEQCRDVQLYSLQVGPGTEQIENAGLRSLQCPDLDLGESSFVDTAAIMANLDLIVTSDTAIAHLAGAMGLTVWMAIGYSADWRWLSTGDTSPWYPTMRIFRQSHLGDWECVFRAIAKCLDAMSSKRC